MSFEPVSKLDGHVAVITGGKGAIGWATARRLAALGARIVSIDRSDPEKVQALLDTLPKVASGAHFALTASITDSAALNAAAEAVKQRAGRCDILVNSAGFTKPVAAKAGVDLLTKALGKALAPHIRVIAVSPGVVDSSFVPGRGAEFNEKAAATIPLQRIGHVDDTAAAIEACATTMRFATGSRFVVDGGRSL